MEQWSLHRGLTGVTVDQHTIFPSGLQGLQPEGAPDFGDTCCFWGGAGVPKHDPLEEWGKQREALSFPPHPTPALPPMARIPTKRQELGPGAHLCATSCIGVLRWVDLCGPLLSQVWLGYRGPHPGDARRDRGSTCSDSKSRSLFNQRSDPNTGRLGLPLPGRGPRTHPSATATGQTLTVSFSM